MTTFTTPANYNRATRWEIIFTDGAGMREVLTITGKKTKAAIVAAARAAGETIFNVVGDGTVDWDAKSKALRFSSGHMVCFGDTVKA